MCMWCIFYILYIYIFIIKDLHIQQSFHFFYTIHRLFYFSAFFFVNFFWQNGDGESENAFFFV